MSLKAKTHSAITIGNFDGVHIGHAALISKINAFRNAQAPSSCKSIVITFDPHPMEVLRPKDAPKRLCSIEERVAMIKNLGADEVKIIPFNLSFSKTPAREFFEKVLIDDLNPKFICVGQNFYFGHNREGSPHKIVEWAQALSIKASILEAVAIDGAPVSSSRIREAILNGHVANANRLLGHTFKVTGKVIKGDGRGHKIGFPTANLEIDERNCLPKSGVYATIAILEDGSQIQSVSNIGHKPSFGNNLPKSLECHLLDFDEELYGKTISVEFCDRLRDEMRFSSVDALSQQIQKDIQKARLLLGTY